MAGRQRKWEQSEQREGLKSLHNNGPSTHSIVFPPVSAGYKIYDLTLTPAKTQLAAGERLVLSCTAVTELNVGIEFNWTHSGQALVSTRPLGSTCFSFLPTSCFQGIAHLFKHATFSSTERSRCAYTWLISPMFVQFSDAPLLELSEQLQADVRNTPQEEAVELSGTVQHVDSGERDCGPQWRIHLHCIQWADGEK